VFDEARQLAIARLEDKDKTNMDKVAKRMKYEQLLLADAAWTRSCILMGHVSVNKILQKYRLVENSLVLSRSNRVS